MDEHTIVEYYPEHNGHRCGYCKSADSSLSHGMWAHSMTVQNYEDLLNRGWRRSGCYLYKPTNLTTCCPLYTISCHALDFKLSKSQKKVLKKFSGHLGINDPKEKTCIEDYFENTPGFTVKYVKNGSEEFKASMTEEHDLYKRYQMKIHDDTEESCNFQQFKRFLCRTPLTSPSAAFGSYHHQYYIKDKLIAVGVVDILPSCLSSVYFFYDPDFMTLSLGTFGALYEIMFVRRMHKEVPNFRYYYMGFYIHSCQKMRYKGNFSPSYLLCPENYTWRLLDDELRKTLDHRKYVAFGESKNSQNSNHNILEDIQQVTLLYKRTIMPYTIYKLHRKSDDDKSLQEYVDLVGSSNAKSILLYR